MGVPTQAIQGCRRAHGALAETLESLTDEMASSASALAGWSVGHLLTHIARNADSVVCRLEGAVRDEVVDQYEGGLEGRSAQIEDGAGRCAQALVADVRDTSAQVDQLCASLSATMWDRMSRDVHGAELPVHTVVFARWREVEVHHVDLGLGYTPDRWPRNLVGMWLPLELDRLAGRCDPTQLLAWIIGRGEAPQLPAWSGGFGSTLPMPL